MPLAVCCVSHSPLLELPGPGPELRTEVGEALDRARDFVRDFDPELVVLFAPDHYNGFFYKLMPPFCLGTAATAVGDYGTHAGPLNVPEDIALRLAEALLESGIDIATSAEMSVDHGTVQPLQRLFGDATARPVVPIFVNSVATPLGPLRRVRALGTAVGRHLATLGKRVLIIGSGGLSHDPPVPRRGGAPEPVLERIVHGRPMTIEQRAARQAAVIAAARDFAAGDSPLQALNPDWDRAFLELVDTGELAAVDDWDNSEITRIAGNSAHEIRTWVAAFAALAAQGAYHTGVRYYRPAPELIAGFAVRTARPADERSDDRRRAVSTDETDFDETVDLLVIGSGGGGMSAALRAEALGLDTLVVEKADYYGGSTALSGGGIWVPNAPAQQRDGFALDPDAVVGYLRTITGGLVTEERLRAYVERSPDMMAFLEERSSWLEFVWKPGYADYYPEIEGGSAQGSTINVPPIDLRELGDEEAKLLKPLALAPKGIWLGPKDLRMFYQVRQNWRGKAVLLKLIWRMLRAHVFGDRIAAIGQSLIARLRLAMKERDIPLWLSSPMTSLITGADGQITGAVVTRDGKPVRIRARHGVILATGGFDHDMTWRNEELPEVDQDWSFGNPVALGDGIRAGQQAGADTALMDEAWWFPAIQWPDGRMQFMLNERMMPAQFIVNGAGKRFINEAAPYMDFGHAMIEGQRTGVTHIPCWLITDHRSWHKYVIGGHLPIPKVPFAPVPTGYKMVAAWLESGVVKAAGSYAELAAKIEVPVAELEATAARFDELARGGHDDDFQRGDSVYDNYYGDPTLPNPNLFPLGKPPYYAFRIVLGDLGTSGGLRTDEHARVLRADGSAIDGLYAVGNASAAVMGRSYAGAGATIGPAMTFGYLAAEHCAGRARSGAPGDTGEGAVAPAEGNDMTIRSTGGNR